MTPEKQVRKRLRELCLALRRDPLNRYTVTLPHTRKPVMRNLTLQDLQNWLGLGTHA